MLSGNDEDIPFLQTPVEKFTFEEQYIIIIIIIFEGCQSEWVKSLVEKKNSIPSITDHADHIDQSWKLSTENQGMSAVFSAVLWLHS